MDKRYDLSGRTFSRLKVVSYVGKDKFNQNIWKCLCSCGNEAMAISSSLLRGRIKSCGCLRKEMLVSSGRTHGLSKIDGKKTRLFRIWMGIKTRCFNDHNKAFKNYGGRGIKICAEWLNYENFHNWALENGYSDTLSIERKNTNGDYEPGNCMWVTAKVQANNRRANRLISYNDKVRTMAQWAEQYGISTATLFGRLKRNWPIEKALSIPVNRNKKMGVI